LIKEWSYVEALKGVDLDYQSQKSLYEKMGELKKDGASFLFIGKEFEELRTISDRRCVNKLPCQTPENLLYYIHGKYNQSMGNVKRETHLSRLLG